MTKIFGKINMKMVNNARYSNRDLYSTVGSFDQGHARVTFSEVGRSLVGWVVGGAGNTSIRTTTQTQSRNK